MGNIHTGVPRELAVNVQAACGVDTFIETGTYLGETTAWAAERFKKVVTIEINPELHRRACERFLSLPHVECLQGDCRDVLEMVLPRMRDSAPMIWLDAHICGGEDQDSPLLEEIELINRHCPEASILIDDARFILAAIDGRRLCTLGDLIRALDVPSGDRYLAVFEDVVIAVPKRARAAVDAYVKQRCLDQRKAYEARMAWRKSLRGRIVTRLQRLSGFPDFQLVAPVSITLLALVIRKMRSAWIRLCRKVAVNPDRYLKDAVGVIHIGANIGQERSLYDRYGLPVIWVEPDPDVFSILKGNIAAFPRQLALQYLITDLDDIEQTFHVASNGGASSSIMDLKLHKEVWPEVEFTGSLTLRGITLASLVSSEKIAIDQYDALVVDAQGAELMVLKGAGSLLHHFRWIKVEVPDFEAYEGCCLLADIREFLFPLGYQETLLRRFGFRSQGGCYYDFLYERKRSSTAG